MNNIDEYIMFAETESPKGQKCIVMIYKGKRYLLCMVRRATLAKAIVQGMRTLGIDAFVRLDLHVENAVLSLPDDPEYLDVVGIYVLAEQYDDLDEQFKRM